MEMTEASKGAEKRNAKKGAHRQNVTGKAFPFSRGGTYVHEQLSTYMVRMVQAGGQESFSFTFLNLASQVCYTLGRNVLQG